MPLTSIELCAGAGGQAIGLEQAGYKHIAVVEIDHHAAVTLRKNRPEWNTVELDIGSWNAKPFAGVDLLAGGLPCPPFSKAGKQLGANDERNLFPIALRIIGDIQPRAIMIENVRGILDPLFQGFRDDFSKSLKDLGYVGDWKLFNASDFGVPQLRPRVIFVAMKADNWKRFKWPTGSKKQKTVGETLLPLMRGKGWGGAEGWAKAANEIAPTLVGGSKKHGGADLGPTRAKKAWAKLQVDGNGVADEAPGPDFVGMPKLTVPMCALLQGFPAEWKFSGGKTAAYKQVGNAFPPAVACEVGLAIAKVLGSDKPVKSRRVSKK